LEVARRSEAAARCGGGGGEVASRWRKRRRPYHVENDTLNGSKGFLGGLAFEAARDGHGITYHHFSDMSNLKGVGSFSLRRTFRSSRHVMPRSEWTSTVVLEAHIHQP
jgi:hypothetical protein